MSYVMPKATILIVEDEWIIADDLRNSLEKMNYRISSVVASAEEALAAAEKDRPDLVLMDIILKDRMNGIEAAANLHRNFNIPHIFITAYGNEAMLEKAKVTEPFGYLLKPFDDKELNAAIEMALYRHNMEAKLKESEERFKGLVETTSDWIWEVDENGVYTYVSPRVRDILGYEPEEILGMKPFDLMPPEEAKRIADVFALIAASQKEFRRLENINIHKDGGLVVLETSGVPLFDTNGIYRGYRGIDRDITARKKAEEKLKESEQRFQGAFQYSAIGIALVSIEGRWLRVNEALCNIVGYTEEELLSMTFQDMTHPDDLQADLEYVRQMLAGERQNYYMEKRYIHRDGHIVWILLSVSLVRDSNGAPLHFVSQVQDITERKVAADELQRQKDTLQKYLDISAVMVVMINRDCKVTLINRKGCEILGYREDEVIGEDWFDNFIPERYRRQVKKVFLQLIAGETVPVEYYENPVLTRSGEEKMIAWYNTVFKDDEGHIVATLGSGGDITERKRAEQERDRLNDELAKKNREMEQLVYVTSHDLRTPLAIIQGYARELEITIKQMVSEIDTHVISPDMKGGLTPYINDIRDISKYIRSNIHKMDALLYGLLQLSRSGNVALNMIPLDMNRLAAEVKESYMYKIKEAGARVEISDLPGCIGDAVQINQVFSNLLGNALKYLDPGRTGVVRICGYRERHESFYCLEDNGIGMAPEEQGKVFTLFYQGSPSTAGEGLGLTIVSKILERHNGRIWIESKPGKGSRFYVALPAE